MMKNKSSSDKRLNSDSGESQSGDNTDRSIYHSKQSKASHGSMSASSSSSSGTLTPIKSSVMFSTPKQTHVYSRCRSKSSVTYTDSKASKSKNSDSAKLFDPSSSSNLSSSLINAFQMPQNIAQAFPQVFPNMPSLPDYLSQLPSVSMPSMPNISIPNIQMPSIPSLSMPSMPNLSMPNISMPNINIPSISDLMSFPGRKNCKSWAQICMDVRDSRKRFTDVCPSLPFNFNFCYDFKNEKLRIYFLSSLNSPEATLFYCDVPLVSQPPSIDKNQENRVEIFSVDEEMNFDHDNAQPNKSEHLNLINSDKQCNNISPGNSYQTKSNLIDINADNSTNIEMEYNDDIDLEYNDSSHCSSSKTSFSLSSSSSSDSSIQTSMYYSDIRKTMTSPTSSMKSLDTIGWHPLILMNKAYFQTLFEDSKIKQSDSQSNSESPLSGKNSSHEEDLILQRKRLLFSGIVSYDFNPQIARFVFTIKNIIYWFDDVSITHQNDGTTSLNSSSSQNNLSNRNFPSPPPYIPHKLMTNTFVKMNATMCPHNPDIVAYVADHDIWVCDLVSCKEMRLTSTEYSKSAIMAGKPSFVMQEEFSRFNGFWWRPVNLNENENQVYSILCEYVDESVVEQVAISTWDGLSEIHRFPKAGCTNSKSTLKVVHFSLNDLKTISKANSHYRIIKIEDLPVSFETLFPEYEYLIRCGWHSYDVVWAQLLNRRQNKIVIVFVSLSMQFSPQILYEESHENHWYNCHDVFYFYSNSSKDNSAGTNNSTNCDKEVFLTVGDTITFLWSSEISGFRHLYKITKEISGYEDKQNIEDSNVDQDLESEKLNVEKNTILHSKTISIKQITNGNWEVSDSYFWVDEENDFIYFIANKDSPLENHLYVVSGSASPRIIPRRLSKEDFTHTRIIFDPKFKFCIDLQSNLTVPPFAYIHKLTHSENSVNLVNLDPLYFFMKLPEDVSVDDSIEYYDKVKYLGPTPQLFEYKLNSGELIYGFLFKPYFMEPGFKYPVLLEIYGGPEVQFVSKSFKDIRQHRRHLIASEGYIVVGFDSRGSKHRGVDFEKHIYKRLGQVEICDQVEALKWLAENTGFIDMSRVAIHGWSYGGYLSLMALARRPDIFKCAIAGAPVTNWYLYDTGYTERYMGLPEDNEEGYRLSNVLSYIKHFPNEHNRLLIIHGLMDENVHFGHTAQLIHGLIMVGKPYNLNVFPYERHSLRRMYSSEHYEATLLYYLQQNL